MSDPIDIVNELYTSPKMLAKTLDVTPAQIWAWAQALKIEPVLACGNKLYFREDGERIKALGKVRLESLRLKRESLELAK